MAWMKNIGRLLRVSSLVPQPTVLAPFMDSVPSWATRARCVAALFLLLVIGAPASADYRVTPASKLEAAKRYVDQFLIENANPKQVFLSVALRSLCGRTSRSVIVTSAVLSGGSRRGNRISKTRQKTW